MTKARRKPNPAKDRCSECGYLHCGLSHQVTVLKAELRFWKKLADNWMKDCDRLKEKYEPTVLVPSCEGDTCEK